MVQHMYGAEGSTSETAMQLLYPSLRTSEIELQMHAFFIFPLDRGRGTRFMPRLSVRWEPCRTWCLSADSGCEKKRQILVDNRPSLCGFEVLSAVTVVTIVL
jgi:hypothetical protein